MAAEIIRLDEFGVLTTGFRNIRCTLDGSWAAFELVPEHHVEVSAADLDEARPEMRSLLAGANRVVEGALALRIKFNRLIAIAGDADVDTDMFGGLHQSWSNAPRLQGSNMFYPLLEIRSSPWKARLPEWRGRDDPLVRHIRMISAECSFDVLGYVDSGVWVANAAGR